MPTALLYQPLLYSIFHAVYLRALYRAINYLEESERLRGVTSSVPLLMGQCWQSRSVPTAPREERGPGPEEGPGRGGGSARGPGCGEGGCRVPPIPGRSGQSPLERCCLLAWLGVLLSGGNSDGSHVFFLEIRTKQSISKPPRAMKAVLYFCWNAETPPFPLWKLGAPSSSSVLFCNPNTQSPQSTSASLTF